MEKQSKSIPSGCEVSKLNRDKQLATEQKEKQIKDP